MTMSSSSSSHSPCAACKFLRQKCTQECVFAPYFPTDQPQKFANVHRVYGASNVGKLLNKLSTVHREEAVSSLAFEAEARLRDPVYGCVGSISILQNRLRQVQNDVYAAKKELAAYVGPQAMIINQPQLLINSEPQQHQQQHPLYEAHEEEDGTVKFNYRDQMMMMNTSMSPSLMGSDTPFHDQNAYLIQHQPPAHYQYQQLQPQVLLRHKSSQQG